MDSTDIFVNGSAENVRQAVLKAFEYNQFKVQWQTETSGVASKGSKGKNLALGALAQYYEIGFQIITTPDASLALRLTKTNSGWAGGALGAHKVKKQYEDLTNGLSSYFQAQGIFKGKTP
ncbi:MAG TPA: hypothetical protein VMB46_07620 [Methanomassiliicoccales archaeon]|nr:hypothetical protein [Methanomassiliicoccales archaeon]